MTFTVAATVLAVLLVGAAAVQLACACLFRRHFLRLKPNQISNQISNEGADNAPDAAVVIAVRGCDPSLSQAIDDVLNQNYSGHYQVHIVVDHPDDPAKQLLEKIQESHPHRDRLHLHDMTPPPSTCGLKCHCLAQAVEQLDKTIEVVAFLDADVTPHPGWLSALAAPLNESSIGGVTGTQWFAPPMNAGFGSWLRSVWNGGAAILTMYFANPWAGSFAMRKTDITQSNLVEIWRQSIVDDGPIRSAIESLDKNVVFAPSLVMINREHCSTRYVINWAARMLTWSRLYEPTFWITILHAAFSNFVMLGNVLIVLLAIARIIPALSGIISLAALLLSGFYCAAAYTIAKSCVNDSCQLSGRPHLRFSFFDWLWGILCAGPAHLMFGWGCLAAIFTKNVVWRGIRYRLKNDGKVQRLNYVPFSKTNSDQKESI
jgi:glycosyltransferase involved in cell wall biosynthesis